MARRSQHLMPERDRAVVELVGRFKQLTAQQLGSLVFADLASNTPRDRTLKRLSEQKYLSRMNRRRPGGHGGGSSQYVYQLGRQGWRLLELPGDYHVYRSVSDHIIELADVYVTLKAAERAGVLEVIRFDREQDGWIKVGSVQLTPDAYLEVGCHATRTKASFFLELDRGTEKAAKIRDKCIRYWHAYEGWTSETFPFVLFVVPDDHRKREIESAVNAGPDGARNLLSTVVAARFVDTVLNQTTTIPIGTI